MCSKNQIHLLFNCRALVLRIMDMSNKMDLLFIGVLLSPAQFFLCKAIGLRRMDMSEHKNKIRAEWCAPKSNTASFSLEGCGIENDGHVQARGIAK